MQREPAVADGAPERPGSNRAAVETLWEEHEKGLVVVRRTPEMVGELDEHQGLNTTHVTLPASTTTFR